MLFFFLSFFSVLVVINHFFMFIRLWIMNLMLRWAPEQLEEEIKIAWCVSGGFWWPRFLWELILSLTHIFYDRLIRAACKVSSSWQDESHQVDPQRVSTFVAQCAPFRVDNNILWLECRNISIHARRHNVMVYSAAHLAPMYFTKLLCSVRGSHNVSSSVISFISGFITVIKLRNRCSQMCSLMIGFLLMCPVSIHLSIHPFSVKHNLFPG